MFSTIVCLHLFFPVCPAQHLSPLKISSAEGQLIKLHEMNETNNFQGHISAGQGQGVVTCLIISKNNEIFGEQSLKVSVGASIQTPTVCVILPTFYHVSMFFIKLHFFMLFFKETDEQGTKKAGELVPLKMETADGRYSTGIHISQELE